MASGVFISVRAVKVWTVEKQRFLCYYIENSEKFSLYPYETWYNNSMKTIEKEVINKNEV